MSSLTTVTIKETSDSVFSAEVKVGKHSILSDEPPENPGGKDLGPSPFDLLTSALSACTVMTMRWYAERKEWPLVQAEANVVYDQKENHFTKEIILHGDELTEEQKAKLVDIAAKCPVQKSLLGETSIDTKAVG